MDTKDGNDVPMTEPQQHSNNALETFMDALVSIEGQSLTPVVETQKTSDTENHPATGVTISAESGETQDSMEVGQSSVNAIDATPAGNLHAGMDLGTSLPGAGAALNANGPSGNVAPTHADIEDAVSTSTVANGAEPASSAVSDLEMASNNGTVEDRNVSLLELPEISKPASEIPDYTAQANLQLLPGLSVTAQPSSGVVSSSHTAEIDGAAPRSNGISRSDPRSDLYASKETPVKDDKDATDGTAQAEQEEFRFDSSDLEDSDTETESESDDSDAEPLMDPKAMAEMLSKSMKVAEPDSEPPKTKNEMPMIHVEKPTVEITPEMKISFLGQVEVIITPDKTSNARLVSVKAQQSAERNVYDCGTYLCLEDRQILGVIDEAIGRVQDPYYTFFITEEDIQALNVTQDTAVYIVDQFSSKLFTDEIMKMKGTDASNLHDEELHDSEMEFSDDEKEAEYKRQKKAKAKGKKAANQGQGDRKPTAPASGERRQPFLPQQHQYGAQPGMERPLVKYDDDDDMSSSRGNASTRNENRESRGGRGNRFTSGQRGQRGNRYGNNNSRTGNRHSDFTSGDRAHDHSRSYNNQHHSQPQPNSMPPSSHGFHSPSHNGPERVHDVFGGRGATTSSTTGPGSTTFPQNPTMHDGNHPRPSAAWSYAQPPPYVGTDVRTSSGRPSAVTGANSVSQGYLPPVASSSGYQGMPFQTANAPGSSAWGALLAAANHGSQANTTPYPIQTTMPPPHVLAQMAQQARQSGYGPPPIPGPGPVQDSVPTSPMTPLPPQMLAAGLYNAPMNHAPGPNQGHATQGYQYPPSAQGYFPTGGNSMPYSGPSHPQGQHPVRNPQSQPPSGSETDLAALLRHLSQSGHGNNQP